MKSNVTTSKKPAGKRRNTRNFRAKYTNSTLSKYKLAPPSIQHMLLRFKGTQLMNRTVPTNRIIFTANSIYDCVEQTGLQQPYLRDQMFSIYEICRVMRYQIKVTIMGHAVTVPAKVVLAPVRDGVVDQDLTLAEERKGSRSCYVNANTQRTLVVSDWVNRYFGEDPKVVLTSDLHQQSAGADTGSLAKCKYQLLVDDPSGSIENGAPLCYVDYTISMWCRFERPLDQVSS